VYYRSVAIANAVPEMNIHQPIETTTAFGNIPGAVGTTEPAIRVRRKFPETWLWHMLEAG
jgi:hypothetical protein